MTRILTVVGRIAFAILPIACTQPPRSHTIEIRDFKYVPATLEVRVGDTLIFVNHDIVPHTATARDTTWNTGDLAAKATARIVARERGDYFCAYHPTMTALIEIE